MLNKSLFKYPLFCLALFLSPVLGSAQAVLYHRQVEVYTGLSELAIPNIDVAQAGPSDSLIFYTLNPNRQLFPTFGLGYRRQWDNGRYLLLAVPRLLYVRERPRPLSRYWLSPSALQKSVHYLSLRGEFGKQYYSQSPISFRLGMSLEALWTQTAYDPAPGTASYATRFRKWASHLAIHVGAQWHMSEKLTLQAGIDPLIFSIGVEETRTQAPGLDDGLRRTSILDVDGLIGNNLFVGLAYRLEE